MDFSQSAIIAFAVVLAIGYAATDRGVDLVIFVHHIQNPPLKVQTVWLNFKKILTFLKNYCTIEKKGEYRK